jgi:hypothetical protein
MLSPLRCSHRQKWRVFVCASDCWSDCGWCVLCVFACMWYFVCVCMYVVFCVCLHVCGQMHTYMVCAPYTWCARRCAPLACKPPVHKQARARAQTSSSARAHTHTHTHTRTMTHIHRCDNMRCSMCDGVFRWGMLHNTTQGVVAQHAPPSTRQPSTSVAASAMNL